MNKTNGRVQVLNGRVFFSPNCDRTVGHPPPIQHEEGGESNPFLPSPQQNGRRNYFELDITKYANPRWWTPAFGWIAFFPLMPSFCGQIFEKLFMPRSHHHVFNEELEVYSMPSNLSNKWLRVESDLSDAVYLICRHYQLPFVYPINPSSFGYSRGHQRSGALHMALRRGRDWFVVWMALLSYVIAGAENIHASVKNSAILSKPSWFDILLQHFDIQWLEALYSSTVYSFSPYTLRTGVFLELEGFDSYQPQPEFYCQFHVPVWYPWSSDVARRYEHLAPLPHQLQEGTTFLTKSPQTLTSTPTRSLPPLAGSSTQTKHNAWVEFISKRKQHYEERVKKETPQQQQLRLTHLRNPPKTSAKVFEWLEDDNGDLCRQAVPKSMREDILSTYLECHIYYDPIENEYDCCEEYDSGTPGGPLDDDDDMSWDGDDMDINQVDDNRILPSRVPSPEVEIDDSWNLQSVESPDPKSPDSFIAEVHRILFMQFGYTPLIPVPTFHSPVLKTESDIRRFIRFFGFDWEVEVIPAFETAEISAAATFVNHLHTKGSSISADEWDLSRENRQSIFFSTRLKALRCIGQGLLMFDFKERSTVKWKLTLKTAAHALLVCRLDPHLDESDLAYYLWQNGIPFHTLQLSTTLGRSPISRHPPLIIPFRPANYVFTWRDYEAFRHQCQVIFSQPRGRAALLRGYYPWRLAINDISFSSIISGPSGWSTEPEEMLVVNIPETGEEFIDDKLTDVELKLLTGMYNATTSVYFITNCWLTFLIFFIYFEDIQGQQATLSWYPPIIKYEESGRNAGRWTEMEEAEFSLRHSLHMEEVSSNANGVRRGPLPTYKWKNGLRGSSDIHHAMLRIKMEALRVIEGR
jgi:hypothetical protein